jgi:hypothetical protein
MNRTTFYNQKDFDADIRMSKEYINEDMGLFIYLFPINITGSKKDIYGESMPNEKEFLEPIKLSAFVSISKSEFSKLGSNMVTNENMESVKFGIYLDEIEKLNLDPKKGDFILYDDNQTKRFFEVNTITNITTSNQMYNYKPFFKEVTSTYVRDYRLPQNLKNLI